MADVRRCSCYDPAFLVTLKSNSPLESAVQFDGIEVRSCTSRERKIKSRTEIRRADKIELKNVISSRRKLFVFIIMETKNIYRFSRDSEN
jgi:hypothetical protein